MLKCGRVWGCAALTVLINLSMTARADAEPTAQGAAAPAAPPPDVVRMKDGGLLRGTIAESVPGSFVTIVLLTGETRKIAFSEVEYAGPADAAPGATPKKPIGNEDDADAPAKPAAQPARNTETHRPLVTVRGAEANISFSSTPNAHTLYRRDGTATAFGSNGVGVIATGFSEICTAPCEASLPAGTYTFGVSKPKGVAVESDQVTLPAGSSQLHADYTDNSGLRLAGWVTMFGGIGIGSVLFLEGLMSGGIDCSGSTGECTDKPRNSTLLYGGAAVEIGGLLAGLILINQKDGASLVVTPGGPASGSYSARGNVAAAERALPKGVTFSGHF